MFVLGDVGVYICFTVQYNFLKLTELYSRISYIHRRFYLYVKYPYDFEKSKLLTIVENL